MVLREDVHSYEYDRKHAFVQFEGLLSQKNPLFIVARMCEHSGGHEAWFLWRWTDEPEIICFRRVHSLFVMELNIEDVVENEEVNDAVYY